MIKESAQASLQGKIALITGASRGIGRAVAKKLAENRVHVIALARTKAALEELDDEISAMKMTATLVPMNLQDYDAIDRLASQLQQRWQKIDILIANAATLGALAPVSHINPSLFKDTIALNLIANYRIIRAFDNLLNQSKNRAHAIFITSSAAARNTPYWSAYASSKAALDSLVMTYANENIKKNMCVQLFNPGPVRTDMYQKAFPGKDLKNITSPANIADSIIEILLNHHDKTACVFDYRKNTFLPC